MTFGFLGSPFWRKVDKGLWGRQTFRGCGAVRCISASCFRHGPFCPTPLMCANLGLLTSFKPYPQVLGLPGKSQASRFSCITPRLLFPAVPNFVTHLSFSLSSLFFCPDFGEDLAFPVEDRREIIIPKPSLQRQAWLPTGKCMSKAEQIFALSEEDPSIMDIKSHNNVYVLKLFK